MKLYSYKIRRLNPCFCGIYSQSNQKYNNMEKNLKVLILVFVEFTLRVSKRFTVDLLALFVLILVFVEFTLRD